MLEGYVTTGEAQTRLGYRQRQTVDAKCRAYRMRIQAIQASGREPSAAEVQPEHPRELRCLWFGLGPAYLVDVAQLETFRAHHAGGRGRPLGAVTASTAGTKPRRRKSKRRVRGPETSAG